MFSAYPWFLESSVGKRNQLHISFLYFTTVSELRGIKMIYYEKFIVCSVVYGVIGFLRRKERDAEKIYGQQF